MKPEILDLIERMVQLGAKQDKERAAVKGKKLERM
jgi:hypothetical protein